MDKLCIYSTNILKNYDLKCKNIDSSYLLLSLFEKMISGKIYFYIIGKYLDNNNLKLLSLLSKNMYNNINKLYTYKIINERILKASKIILKFMKNYTIFVIHNKNNLDIINWVNVSKKNIAVYYFRNYSKKHINGIILKFHGNKL